MRPSLITKRNNHRMEREILIAQHARRLEAIRTGPASHYVTPCATKLKFSLFANFVSSLVILALIFWR